MCGLAGKVLFDGGVVTPGLLKRMCDRLAHRGPDDESYYASGSFGLGHRRLSIIDLASGRQPIPNEDRTVWVALNGEIYNYIELRAELAARGHRFHTSSDTEVIVHLYEERGDAFVDALRGMFAIALWDDRARVLILARDRAGKKPLYYSVVAGRGLVFASELSALVEDADVAREIDLEAVDAYLSLQYVPSPLTIYKSAKKLPAAHVLRCSAEGVTMREYWDVPFTDAPDPVSEDLREELIAALGDAVRVRLRSDVPLGAFLSGGLDSSAIVALMAEQLPGPVVACTATFDDAAHDEAEHARDIAMRFRCEHHERAVRPKIADLASRVTAVFDEPFADAAAVPNLLIAEAAREHVKVALTGDGGDELFAGYWRHSRQALERRLRGVFGPLATFAIPALAPWLAPESRRLGLARFGMPDDRSYASKHCGVAFDPSLKARLYTGSFTSACRDFDPSARFRHFWHRCAAPDVVSKALYVDFKTSLVDGILVKVDRTSMAHGLEIRSPLLDHRVVELAARVPSSLKLHNGHGKYLLARAMASRVPPAVLDRPKHGLTTPMSRWLRSEWRETAEDCLFGAASRDRGWFEPRFVQSMWNTHVAGNDCYTQQLWTLVALELWRRQHCN